jgi:hypothetical protein
MIPPLGSVVMTDALVGMDMDGCMDYCLLEMEVKGGVCAVPSCVSPPSYSRLLFVE